MPFKFKLRRTYYFDPKTKKRVKKGTPGAKQVREKSRI
jgi:hypothetical protein